MADYYSDVRWHGSREPAIAAIRDALRDDPYSAGMHRALAGLLLEAGDQNAADLELMMVHNITPRSAISVFVNVNPATR